MSTVRQSIMDLLDTYFKAISIANGYSLDISGNVFEWQDHDLAEADVPAIIFKDVGDISDDDDERVHNLEIEVAVVAKGSTSPGTMREMMKDVLTAFSQIEDQATAAIIGAGYTGSVSEIDRDNKRWAESVMRFIVQYQTDYWEI